MTNFLLIHGAFHGAWCWEPLSRELARRGHSAFSLDLPGHGKDLTPRREVTRSSYIDSVSSFLATRELKEVTLVGHSLAGIILPDLYRRNRRSIRSVVFLAGEVLDRGESVLDLIPAERRSLYIDMARQSSDNSFMIDREQARRMFFSDLSHQGAETYSSKLTPQPLAVYLEKAESAPRLKGVRVRYLQCTDDQTLSRELCVSCAAKLGVIPEEIEGGHDIMLSRPSELAEILVAGTA